MPICTQDPGVCCASHLADLAPFPWCCAATTIQIMIFAPFVSYFWSNYSDLTWTHPKLWFSKGNLLISGKTALVKYYNLTRYFMFQYVSSISHGEITRPRSGLMRMRSACPMRCGGLCIWGIEHHGMLWQAMKDGVQLFPSRVKP